MSSRAFRRLQNDNFVIKLPANEAVDEEEESEESQPITWQPQKKKNAINPFDMLTGDGEDSLPEEEEEENEEVKEEREVTVPTQSVQISKKKKKKRKKRDHKETGSNPVVSPPDDEVETALKEVTDMLGGLETVADHGREISSARTPSLKPLLCVDRRYLNADNEMRRIFGSRVVRGDQSQRRRHQRRFQKQSILATPKDTWPQIEKLGLTMSLQQVQNNCQYFKFEHSLEYQKVQFSFWDAVDSYDPNAIAAVLHAHPYHIDSLLQLSEVCKMGEDWQMAADLIERAVYSFESSFHPLFNYTQDSCRLDYSQSENRSLFLVLFRHLNYIGRRGCHRTAFEFCKLLLSLEPDTDPLCTLLLIDYFAIRACEYQFMIDLDDRWETKKNLSQLPNCAFSISLSLFHRSNQIDEEEEKTVLLKRADDKLQTALIMFPSLLVPLLDKCSVRFDPSAQNHSYFTSPKRDPDALKLLISLYIERAHSLWKEPEVLEWLERNVKLVIDRINEGDSLVKEAHEKRQRCYQGTPQNIYRHVLISDMESVTTALPQDITRTPIVMYDPLPPENSTRGYQRPARSRNPLEDDDSNPFALFLRSLLPTFNMQPQPIVPRAAGIPVPGDGEGPEEERGAAAAVRRDTLQQAIGQLTDSLRGLLTQIREAINIDERGERSEGEEEEGSDDDQ